MFKTFCSIKLNCHGIKHLENQRTHLTQLAVYVAFNVVLTCKSVCVTIFLSVWTHCETISCCPAKDLVAHHTSSERRLNNIVNTREAAQMCSYTPEAFFSPSRKSSVNIPRCLKKLFFFFFIALCWICVETGECVRVWWDWGCFSLSAPYAFVCWIKDFKRYFPCWNLGKVERQSQAFPRFSMFEQSNLL